MTRRYYTFRPSPSRWPCNTFWLSLLCNSVAGRTVPCRVFFRSVIYWINNSSTPFFSFLSNTSCLAVGLAITGSFEPFICNIQNVIMFNLVKIITKYVPLFANERGGWTLVSPFAQGKKTWYVCLLPQTRGLNLKGNMFQLLSCLFLVIIRCNWCISMCHGSVHTLSLSHTRAHTPV